LCGRGSGSTGPGAHHFVIIPVVIAVSVDIPIGGNLSEWAFARRIWKCWNGDRVANPLRARVGGDEHVRIEDPVSGS